jgi:hypothetical protein
MKGHQIYHRQIVKDFENKIKSIHESASFRMEALESALIKAKLKANTERE